MEELYHKYFTVVPQPNGFSLICLVYFPSALQELKVVPRPVPALLIARKKGLENMKEKTMQVSKSALRMDLGSLGHFCAQAC